jgi:hypothetical protein
MLNASSPTEGVSIAPSYHFVHKNPRNTAGALKIHNNDFLSVGKNVP